MAAQVKTWAMGGEILAENAWGGQAVAFTLRRMGDVLVGWVAEEISRGLQAANHP